MVFVSLCFDGYIPEELLSPEALWRKILPKAIPMTNDFINKNSIFPGRLWKCHHWIQRNERYSWRRKRGRFWETLTGAGVSWEGCWREFGGAWLCGVHSILHWVLREAVGPRNWCGKGTWCHLMSLMLVFMKTFKSRTSQDCDEIASLLKLHHDSFSSSAQYCPSLPFYRHRSQERSLIQFLSDLHLWVGFLGNSTCNTGRSEKTDVHMGFRICHQQASSRWRSDHQKEEGCGYREECYGILAIYWDATRDFLAQLDDKWTDSAVVPEKGTELRSSEASVMRLWIIPTGKQALCSAETVADNEAIQNGW